MASTSSQNYYVLQASNLTELEAELLSSDAFENGAAGTEETLDFEQKNREYEPVTLAKEKTALNIYFETAPDPKFIENLRQLYPTVHFDLQSKANQDWLAEWKKGFNPFELAQGIWVVPSWCDIPKQAHRVIRIDPGMAFGTGTHETTKLAARLIAKYARQFLTEGQKSLLDVGTGTGILAFLAEHLGFLTIVGNDIDIEARRVARENKEINHFKKTQIVEENLERISSVFGVVVANIIDGVLVKLQAELKKRVTAGGYLLLTGILFEREDLFLKEFSFEGFKLVERDVNGEWVGFLIKKEQG